MPEPTPTLRFQRCSRRHLLFVFSDAVVDMDELERHFPEDFVSPVPWAAQRYFYALLGPERRTLRHNPAHQLLETPDFLTSMWNALALRRTAVPHHEPLAIATLLGLNTDEFDDVEFNPTGASRGADQSLRHKMRQLMEMIAKVSDTAIPAGMIFFSRPKLIEKGFSWAPTSWLKLPQTQSQYLCSPQQAAKLTANGLEVSLPGFILHSIASVDLTGEKIEDFVFPCDRTLERWITVRVDTWALRSKHHRFAVVTEHVPVSRKWQLALLVEVLRAVGQTVYSRIVSTLTIRFEHDAFRIADLAYEWRESQPKGYVGELKAGNVVWCIDGSSVRAQHEAEDKRSEIATSITMRFISAFPTRFIYARGSRWWRSLRSSVICSRHFASVLRYSAVFTRAI